MPSEEEEILQLISKELQSGKSPQVVIQELVQAGLPQNEAVTVVQAVMRQMQGGKGRQAGATPVHHKSMMPYYIMIIAIIILGYLIMYT